LDPLPHYEVFNAVVDLFFVISGFVMVYSSERFFGRSDGPPDFLVRRIVHIVQLYSTMTTIVLTYLLATYGSLAAVNLSRDALVASYLLIPYPQADGLMTPVHGVGWTLNFEMFFYLCFSAALLASRHTGVLLLTAGLCVLVAISAIARLPIALDYLANPIVLEFGFGMLIRLAFLADYRLPASLALGIVLIAAAAVLFSYKWNQVHRVIIWGLPSAAIVAALVFMKEPRISRMLKAFAFLGDASYSRYLAHPIAITLPRHLSLGMYGARGSGRRRDRRPCGFRGAGDPLARLVSPNGFCRC
jgi:peptidoglycan/LPS O-acetylase OafA/YrhL